MDPVASLAEALRHVARDVRKEGEFVDGVSEPTSVGSDFGRKSRPFWEISGYSFTLSNPAAVLLHSPQRPVSIPYLIANILWTAAGDGSTQGIRFWNDHATNFSDDGLTIRSALGPRLFGEPSQYAAAIERLSKDASSRRAMLSFIDAADLTASTRDVPCTIGLQLVVRSGKLNAIGLMRSQSGLMVMPYDIALLTTIQRAAAAELALPVGTYTHFASSFHVYEDEMDLLARVVDDDLASCDLPDPGPFDRLRPLAQLKDRMQSAGREELSALAREIAGPAGQAERFSTAAPLVLAGQALLNVGHAADAELVWNRAGELGRLCGLRAFRSREGNATT